MLYAGRRGLLPSTALLLTCSVRQPTMITTRYVTSANIACLEAGLQSSSLPVVHGWLDLMRMLGADVGSGALSQASYYLCVLELNTLRRWYVMHGGNRGF